MKEINADLKLSSWQKLYFFVLSLLNGLKGFARIKFFNWQPKKIDPRNVSLARNYFDQFLTEKLAQFVGKKVISVLEIGCGKGELQKKLAELGYRGQYTGVDLQEAKEFSSYKNSAFSSRLVLQKIEDYQTADKFDLILSVTSLEHIADDKKVVAKIKTWLKEEAVQIHIVPSFWSFFLYRFHGYRQYTPRRLLYLFGQKDTLYFKLGGFVSFCLQFISSWLGIFKIKAEQRLNNFILRKSRLIPRLDKILSFWAPIYAVIKKYQPNSFKE